MAPDYYRYDKAARTPSTGITGRSFSAMKLLCRSWPLFEVTIMGCALVFTWIVLSIPLIIYHRFGDSLSDDDGLSSVVQTMNNNVNCSLDILYERNKIVCVTEFHQALVDARCSPGDDSIRINSPDADNATALITKIERLISNDMCKDELIPLACLYLIGLCSSSGILIQPTSGQCKEVRDIFCPIEWGTLQEFGAILPDCDMFPQDGEVCQNNTEVMASNSTRDRDSRSCREDFYKDNSSGRCIPNCYTWSQLSPWTLLISDGLLITFSTLALIAASVSAIFIFIKNKELIKFPMAFLFLINIDVAAAAVIVIISVAGRDYLHCFSRNLFDVVELKPPFCIVTVAIMGNFAMETESTGNASFWQRGAGFTQIRIPSNLCSGRNEKVMYYAFLLPLTVIIMLGCSLLVFIIRLIIKQGIKKFKVKESKNMFEFGTAEKKLFVMLIYYVAFATAGLISITLTITYSRDRIEAIKKYFICEQNGHDPTNPCSRSDFERINSGLGVVITVFQSLMPVLHVVMYSVKIKDLRNLWTKCKAGLSKTKRSKSDVELRTTMPNPTFLNT